ncbi:MAG: urease accessory protein [Acidobacteriota bacterium]
MTSILFFGFLIGLRHALEADHLAAVASLATGRRSLGSTVLRGAVWGVGHTLTLLLVGGICLLLGVRVPEHLERMFEGAVGVMLVALGVEVLWRLRRQRVHIHVHRHKDGVSHVHAHRHEVGEVHDPEDHEHPHPEGFPHRALAIGLVHGLAGSAGLLLLAVGTVGTPWLGIWYIVLFGVGSVAGMAVLSAVIAAPFRFSHRRLAGLANGLEGALGLATIALGLWVLAAQIGGW